MVELDYGCMWPESFIKRHEIEARSNQRAYEVCRISIPFRDLDFRQNLSNQSPSPRIAIPREPLNECLNG